MGAALRFLYIYDPISSQITNARDVSSHGDEQVELIRLELLLQCRFPRDVVDSWELGTQWEKYKEAA